MAEARRADRRAVESVLTDSFPAVYRMTHALTGEPRVAAAVGRQVLRRAVRFMPRWRTGTTPENWFYHQTLLLSREVQAQHDWPQRDLLITAGPDEPAFVAFIRALRGLPRQQMEAFLLNHGERLNSRLLGVAMDCSATAAATHLAAASDALHTLSGNHFPHLVAFLERAYATLTPPETIVRTTVVQQVAAALWSIRIRRIMRWVIALTILSIVGYGLWRWHALLIQWIQALKSQATTQRA